MTVAEMTALDLFAVVMTAQVLFWIGLLGVREWPKLENNKQRGMLLAGGFALYGLPVIIALDAMRPLN